MPVRVTFKKYDAGEDSFQGPDVSLMMMPDGPEYYKWWQMPLFWWRVVFHKIAVWRGKYD